MKILQINSVCGVGSTGRIATDLYKVLEEQGHECLIAYGRGSAPEGINAYKIGTNLDNYLHVARTRIFDQHGYGSKKPTMELVKKIKEYNPDVIHLHNLHGYYLNLEVLFNYLAESNKPVVWTLHDCWPFTGHCAYFDYVGCDKWKFGCQKCEQKTQYPTSWGIDNSRRNYENKRKIFNSAKNLTIVTPSQWLANLVSESYLSAYPIRVINNGIDLSIFKPTHSDFKRRYGIENKFVILGVASVWDRRKGLDYLIDLSNRLDKRYKVIIVGVTEKQKDKLPDKIIGITRTHNTKELVEIYSAADVFVNPTLEDNFPTTNLEALACGTPVISFATGGSIESIFDGCGFSVRPGGIEEVVEKINIIKSADCSNIRKKCRSVAENYYCQKNKYKEYIELMKKKI